MARARRMSSFGGDPEEIFSFADPTRTVVEKAERCLTCHAEDAATFTYRSSEHADGSIDCASCHKPHAAAREDRLLAREVPADKHFMGAALESCLGCHQEVRAEVSLNERHRMLEGMVTCADCHNQHTPSPRARLGGFAQETCATCHTDKSGPFVFEHLSQRVDGCTACHTPHGSINRHMLNSQSVGRPRFLVSRRGPRFPSRLRSAHHPAQVRLDDQLRQLSHVDPRVQPRPRVLEVTHTDP